MKVLRVKAMEEKGDGRAEQKGLQGREEGEAMGSLGCQSNFPKIASHCGFIESCVWGQ